MSLTIFSQTQSFFQRACALLRGRTFGQGKQPFYSAIRNNNGTNHKTQQLRENCAVNQQFKKLDSSEYKANSFP
jgi:hypothetical protein